MCSFDSELDDEKLWFFLEFSMWNAMYEIGGIFKSLKALN